MGPVPPTSVGAITPSEPDRLEPSLSGFRQYPGKKKRGAATGPNPTGRGKPGTKRHVISDRLGHPLAVRITGANVPDVKMLEEMVEAIPGLSGGLGRPRKRPRKRHTDKAYDAQWARKALRKRNILPRIARRGIESKERLGRHRWVIERTMSWLSQMRRLVVRYERRDDIHQAFLTIGCCLICFNSLQRFRLC